MTLLERVFGEQFNASAGPPAPIEKTDLRSDRVQNPHDPAATYAVKGTGAKKKEHVGYKVQVAETVTEATLAPGEPTQNFLTGIATQAAHHSDEAGAAQMQAEQTAMGLAKPPVLCVDGADVSAQELVAAAAEGRSLMGPAALPPNPGGRHPTTAFDI